MAGDILKFVKKKDLKEGESVSWDSPICEACGKNKICDEPCMAVEMLRAISLMSPKERMSAVQNLNELFIY